MVSVKEKTKGKRQMQWNTTTTVVVDTGLAAS